MLRRAVLAAVTAAVAIAAVVVDAWSPAGAATPPPNVAMVGDSLVANTSDVDAQTIFADVFTAQGVIGDWTADLSGTFVYELSFWQAAIPAALADAPDAIVVSLGTNDLRYQPSCDDPGALDEFLALIPSSLPVYWIVPNGHTPLAPTCTRVSIHAYMAAIRALPLQYPNVHLLDFQSSWWERHPENFSSGDPLHWSALGAERAARIVLHALETGSS